MVQECQFVGKYERGRYEALGLSGMNELESIKQVLNARSAKEPIQMVYSVG